MEGKKPIIIFVLGSPASGKGTYSTLLLTHPKTKKQPNNHHRSYHHLSAGDLLRQLIDPDTGPLKDDVEIVEAVKSGGTKGLVSAEKLAGILIEKIRAEMMMSEGGSGGGGGGGDASDHEKKEKKKKDVFLLDGFPRCLEQDGVFREAVMREWKMETPNLVLLFSCPKEVARARYMKRKRGDDDERLFEMRYADYERRDMEVVDLYRDSLIEFETDGGTVQEEYFEMMLERLENNPIVKEKGIL